jgi:hypothetical protein
LFAAGLLLRALPPGTDAAILRIMGSHRMGRLVPLMGLLAAAGCSGSTGAGPRPLGSVRPTPAPPDARPAPEARPAPVDAAPEPDRGPVGCWERTYGKPLRPGGSGPSLSGPRPGCPGCEELRAGPKAAGLHVQVLRRLRAIEAALPRPAVDEPLLWVNSGARDGPPDRSMHNQALAVDLVICGLDSRQTARHLRRAGFTCVIEYYDGAGRPCRMAHGDLRGTRWARGAYARGGRKARTCPRKAISKGAGCDNTLKEQWEFRKK